jgi:hypothetical protein
MFLDTHIVVDALHRFPPAVTCLETAEQHGMLSLSTPSQMALIIGCRNAAELRRQRRDMMSQHALDLSQAPHVPSRRCAQYPSIREPAALVQHQRQVYYASPGCMPIRWGSRGVRGARHPPVATLTGPLPAALPGRAASRAPRRWQHTGNPKDTILPVPETHVPPQPKSRRATPCCRAARPRCAGGAASAVGKALPPGW